MSFSPLPLGQRIPPSVHGVSCSLPTMRSVIGYEEKDPEITQHLTSGYPRFVQHPFLKAAALVLLRRAGLEHHQAWPVASRRAAFALQQWLEPVVTQVIEHEGLYGVAFPANAETNGRAKTWLQHSGALASTRATEDFLVRVGDRASVYPEETFVGDAEARVRTYLRQAFAPAADDDLFLANSGMNAIWAAFRAVSAVQAPRGRRVWVQFGWLYLDTIAILQKFTGSPGNYVHHADVFDLDGLRRLFADRGGEIAGVITEVPTNPLLQTPDLAAVHELCRTHGALLVVDPTISSPLAIDVLPHSDVVVNSLTKYTASEGDILFGACVLRPGLPDATALRALVAGELEPVHPRDLARLAAQIGDTAAVVRQTQISAARVVEFLRGHPRVRSVLWALEPQSRDNYLRLARSPDAIGSMISFTVEGTLAAFYDVLRLPKGPSFGMKTTLICPFIYLAHYDLVTTDAGRAQLARHGLTPDLLRLSVGCEPVDDIIAALSEALG
ncbi:MAG: PLP-dependent transferase [Opitutaceae bacterium]